MDIQKIIYEIESHPLVTAVVFFLIFFVGFQVLGKKNVSTSTPGVSVTSTPLNPETFNQQFNSFPVVQTIHDIPAQSVVPPPTAIPPIQSVGGVHNDSLLGANVRLFPNYQNSGLMYYRSPRTGGQIIPVPLPRGTAYAPGAGGRYWYTPQGANDHHLLIANDTPN